MLLLLLGYAAEPIVVLMQQKVGQQLSRTGCWLGDSGMLHMIEHQLRHPPDESSRQW